MQYEKLEKYERSPVPSPMPFIFIKNKRRVVSSGGFSALEENGVICSQRAMLPIQLGVTARCRHLLLLKFELAGSGWV